VIFLKKYIEGLTHEKAYFKTLYSLHPQEVGSDQQTERSFQMIESADVQYERIVTDILQNGSYVKDRTGTGVLKLWNMFIVI
jgi:hypothetical protein